MLDWKASLNGPQPIQASFKLKPNVVKSKAKEAGFTAHPSD
jgi:hypothetical protein